MHMHKLYWRAAEFLPLCRAAAVVKPRDRPTLPIAMKGSRPMTGQDWMMCTNPILMLVFLQGKASERKLRLFACACARSCCLAQLQYDEYGRLVDHEHRLQAVEIAEIYADTATENEVDAAWAAACNASRNAIRIAAGMDARGIRFPIPTYHDGSLHPLHDRRWLELTLAWHLIPCLTAEKRRQVASLRDLFGPLPFCGVAADPSWLKWNNGTVSSLAKAIYYERRFDDLPVLADALELAGCHHAEILGHCRVQGPHVRGCWVLDLLLGHSPALHNSE
jgi:hypothetical protein